MFLFARLMMSYLDDQTSVAELDAQLLPEQFPHGLEEA